MADGRITHTIGASDRAAIPKRGVYNRTNVFRIVSLAGLVGGYYGGAGRFAAGVQWDGEVAYVDGDGLAKSLADRPVDLRDERKREAVREWLRGLPRA